MFCTLLKLLTSLLCLPFARYCKIKVKKPKYRSARTMYKYVNRVHASRSEQVVNPTWLAKSDTTTTVTVVTAGVTKKPEGPKTAAAQEILFTQEEKEKPRY